MSCTATATKAAGEEATRTRLGWHARANAMRHAPAKTDDPLRWVADATCAPAAAPSERAADARERARALRPAMPL